MSYAIDDIFDHAAALIDREDRRIQALIHASPVLSPTPYDPDGVAAMSRALTYVVCGGIFEDLMRQLPAALSQDILSLNLTRSKLPVSLLAVMETGGFRKCAEQTAGALLERLRLLRIVSAHASDARDAEPFDSLLVLADGKTIGPNHFEALWKMLDLPGDWRNDPRDSFLVLEIRAKRNDVAHWLTDPVTIGRSKTYSDLLALLRQARNLIDHTYLNIAAWLDSLT